MRPAFQQNFAKILCFVLPASLLLTWAAPSSLATLSPADGAVWLAPDEPELRYVVRQYSAPAVALCADPEAADLLRDSLQVPAWRGRPAAECCRWRGVSCGWDGAVTKLALSGSRANGSLPTGLPSLLASLRVLDLNGLSALSGTLPPLGRCARLTHAYLFGTALSGTLPRSLPGSLQELECSRCRLSGTLPDTLPRALQYLFLESNRLSGTLPASLSRLRSLTELELSDNRLEGSVPAALGSLGLRHLDLTGNERLTGSLATAPPKSGCSGGSDRYLRGRMDAQLTSSLRPPKSDG